MPQSFVVTFEQKSYTFDGKYWYGTADNMTPPRGIIPKLTALIPTTPARQKKPVTPPVR